jgi:hypothetical protein
LIRPAGAPPATFTLRSTAPWLVSPRTVTAAGGTTPVVVRYRAAMIRQPAVYTGTVSGWSSDTLAGPAFRLVNTIVVPHRGGSGELAPAAPVQPGAVRRAFFVADSARPFAVRVNTWSSLHGVLAALHEPGGMPFRDGGQLQAGADSGAATFRVDARDAVAGVYEADAVGLPLGAATVTMRVDYAPFRVFGESQGGAAVAFLESVASGPIEADVRLLVAGAERNDTVRGRGGAVELLPFDAPAWVRAVVVDASMPPDRWGRFTDFGVSVIDAAGRILAKKPLNYAVGRLELALPEGHADLPLRIHLLPGLAEPGSSEPWVLATSIRLYGDSGVTLTAGVESSHHLRLAPGETLAATFGQVRTAWSLPPGFDPLGIVIAAANGEAWTREVRLAPASP